MKIADKTCIKALDMGGSGMGALTSWVDAKDGKVVRTRLGPITDRLDRGGANNLIAPHTCAQKYTSAEVTSGYLVGLKKVDVFELAERYPEAFNRSYDTDQGVEIASWMA